MRVLCFTSRLCNGGVQTFLTNYAKELSKYDIHLDIVVQTDKEEIHDEMMRSIGSKIYHVAKLSENPFKYLIDIYKILKSEKKYKVIWAHLNYASLPCLLVAYLCNVPIRICHSHSCYDASGMVSKVLRYIFHNIIDILITHKWACSDKAAKWLYKERSNCYIVPNAVDPSKYKYSEIFRKEIRSAYGIAESDLLLLCVGTLSKIKNQQFLILLMKELVKTKKNIKLLLCGDGPIKSHLEDKILESNLTNHIILTGNVNNPEKYMSAADMMLIPSLVEGLPLVVIESQFSTLPCIISSVVPDEAIFTNLVYRAEGFHCDSWIKIVQEVEKKKINRTLFEKHYSSKFDIYAAAEDLAKTFKALDI